MSKKEHLLELYNNVMKTEIAEWIHQKLESMENQTLFKLFTKIQENIENDVYNDTKSFFDDFVQTNRYISKIFSQTSEIGLGLETLNQLLEDELKVRKPPSTKEELKRRLLPLVAELQMISEKMPDQFSQFMQMFHYAPLAVEPYQEPEKPKECPGEQFHIQRLQKLLLKLQSDQTIGDVADLVFTYEIEPRTEGFNDSYELVLEKCQPEILQLIWNYLKSHNIID